MWQPRNLDDVMRRLNDARVALNGRREHLNHHREPAKHCPVCSKHDHFEPDERCDECGQTHPRMHKGFRDDFNRTHGQCRRCQGITNYIINGPRPKETTA